MEISTKSGFKCKVNENKVKDWRYITTSAKIAKSDDELTIVNGVAFLMEFLLGDDYDRLLSHLEKDGVVESNILIEEYREITTYIGEQLKKSQSSLG